MFRRGKLALIAAAAVGTAAAQAFVPMRTAASLGEVVVPRPEVARAAAFGFDNVVSDYHWLQAVQIVGGAGSPEEHGPAIARLVDVATALDPWVDHAYRFAAVWLTATREDVEAADAILERGIAYHPTDWRNRFYLAFNLFFQLGEDAAAADALEPAITMPGAPRYLGRLVARLRAGAGGLEASATFLRELVQNASDPFAKAEYEKALDEIETERRARYLDKARAEYQHRNGHDITSVSDLMEGPGAVLRGLPPEPNGWEWKLDAGSGRIVSTYYGKRYEPHVHPAHRAHAETIRDAQRAASAAADAPEEGP